MLQYSYFPMDDVEKIKRKLDIVDVISSYVPLKQMGRNFKTPCPFHNEKSPSFVVSPERQIWHCFGCGKGGDMFTFVEEFERLDFSESLKVLADKAGIVLTQPAFKSKREEKKQTLYGINHLTAQYYHYLLTQHQSGKEALSYVMDKRGLSKAIVETYQIGYAPGGGTALSQFLHKKKGYSPELLVEAGVSYFKNGRLQDFFLNRLMFPILDSRGNILAFSGRALTDNQMPKYINTKETPIYVKGDTLFGIFQAKEAIRKEQKTLLMEGEFDVISSFKEGVGYAVAVKGTALTEQQIKLLTRFAPKIVFCFDTDAAGTEAQRRSIALITKMEISASVVVPPEGKDPDELLKENPALFKKALKNEQNIYDFLIESAAKKENTESAEGKKIILKKTLPFIVDIQNEIIKEHYLKKLSQLLDTSLESVQKEASKQGKNIPFSSPPKVTLDKKPQQELLEQHLVTLIVQSPNVKTALFTAQSILAPVSLSLNPLQETLTFLSQYFETKDTINPEELNQMMPKEVGEVYDICLLQPLPAISDEAMDIEIKKVAKSVRNGAIKTQLKDLTDQIKLSEKEGDETRTEELQKEFNSIAAHTIS